MIRSVHRLALAALLAAALGPPAAAQDARQVPQSRAAVQLSFAPLVKRAAPAVVNVYAQRVERRRQAALFDDPLFQEFFGGGPVPRERVQRSLGSGVIVEPDGLVVTNYHVVADASEVKVALADKREFAADIVLRDQRADLAVLRMKGVKEKLATLPFAEPDALQVGDLVLAIGNPFGVGQTVTSGIVSALARTNVGVSNFQSFVQTDASINPGNSGGALIDMDGRLAGINTAIFSRSGGSIGIGFAIPVAMVRVVVDSAKAGSERPLRPWLGASLQSVTADIAESLGLDRPVGALVADVAAGGPAEAGGVETGDVIVSIDGAAIADPDDFGYRFATRKLGGTTVVDVLRQGKHVPLTLTLAAAPESTPRDETHLDGASPLAGTTVANLSPALAEANNLPLDAKGVVILDVADGTTAAALGFRKNDIVLGVNGQRIARSSDLKAVTDEQASLWRITILRDGQQISSVFGG